MHLKQFLIFGFLICTHVISAQIEEKQLDKLIQETLTTFDVPGISVGVLKDGKIVYAKGMASLFAGRTSVLQGHPGDWQPVGLLPF